ncbi:TPA: membrane-bound O-acyltransferase family protein [Candidatus Nomurabacteria bacterium]|nr:membrane-bound O-acyltransferase family protein [Candidatus Nomurabacteria bacterium]
MIFNSKQFIIFFPIVVALYYLLPQKFRWLMLLIASCIFYMAFVPKYILILAFTIFIDYFAGILIEKSEGKKRKLFLIISIIANVGILAFFKYFNFFAENINEIATFIHWNYSLEFLHILLPVGLSFHTFQAMSYTIEVYRRNQKAERHIGIYALYVMFFPQLVAGPIERPQNLIHQFYEHHYFNYERVTKGLKLMAWGFIKKIVIADRLAVMVNQIFDNTNNYSGPIFIIATIFFAYQIYCDFSGYTDIARGGAQVLGFNLMNNFDRPYSSHSITEFWRRWHISLSSWFRDYVYFPLGGSQTSNWKIYRNIFIVFLLSGLWHGANWTFVIWGALQAIFLMYERATVSLRNSISEFFKLNMFPGFHSILQVVVTFTLICIGWVFFRAKTLTDAYFILKSSFVNIFDITKFSFWESLPKELNSNIYNVFLAILSIFILEGVQYWLRDKGFEDKVSSLNIFVRWTIYFLMVVILRFLFVEAGQQFIYFQF